MASFFSFIKTKKYPTRSQFVEFLEGTWTWSKLLLYAFIAGLLVCSYLFITNINDLFLVDVPAHGGTLTEGVIGAPHFINPILAATQTDTGLTELIYAGLMKYTPDGSVVPDMAQDYTISPDGKNYQVTLKKGLTFQNKKALTATDVAFTYELLKDELLDPVASGYWQNIQIEQVDAYTLLFRLPQADTSFLSKLTLGIMPQALWSTVSPADFRTSNLNLKPIGSGPFMLDTISYKNNIPSQITLRAFKKHTPMAYLDTFSMAFFANQEGLVQALQNNTINFTSSLLPRYTATITNKNLLFRKIPTTTKIALLRSSHESTFNNSAVTTIISNFIDKNAIIATVENGYGTPLGAPTTDLQMSSDDALSQLKQLGYDLKDGVLQKKGSTLQLTIAVANTESSIAIGQILQKELGTIGIGVLVQVFDQGTFQTGVRQGEYQLIIANSAETDIPPGYQSAIPLYTKTVPHISDTKSIGITGMIPQDIKHRYDNSTQWYTVTERLWKWMTERTMNNK